MGNELNIAQVQVPDFSGVASLAQAGNTSFNNAFDAAHSVLDRYVSGQQRKADAGILNDLGQISNEQQLTDFLSKNPLAGRNLSPEMQKTILDMRKTVLGYGLDRANTGNINANADSTNQATMISGYDFRDRTGKLAADRAMAPTIGQAYANGLQFGQAANGNSDVGPLAGPGGVSPTKAAAAVIQGLVARGVPEHVAVGVAMNSQSESGFNPNIIGDGGTSGGLFQWHGERFTGLQNFAKNQGKPWQDPNVQLDYFMHENATTEKANWDKVVSTGNSQDAAVSFVQNWERPAPGPLAARTAVYGGASGVGGPTPGPNGYIGGAQNGYVANPAILSAIAALKNNPYATSADYQAVIDTLTGAQKTGQGEIAARDAAAQKLAADQAIITSVQNPNRSTPAAIQAGVLNTLSLNPTTALGAAGGAGALVAPGGALAAVASPPVATDPSTAAGLDAQNTADNTALGAMPGTSKDVVLKKFLDSADPVATLVEQANKTGGGVFFDTVTLNNDTRKSIQTLADKAGVTVAQMAATLADITDPSTEVRGWGLNDRPSLNKLLQPVNTGGLGGVQNFLSDPLGDNGLQKIIDTAKADAAKVNDVHLQTAANTKTAAQHEGLKLQISQLQENMAKVYNANPNDPRLPGMQAQLEGMKQSAFNPRSNTERTIQQIRMLDPANPQVKTLAQQLVTQMLADPTNPDNSQANIAAVKSKFGI